MARRARLEQAREKLSGGKPMMVAVKTARMARRKARMARLRRSFGRFAMFVSSC
jgi:hypothetical protein